MKGTRIHAERATAQRFAIALSAVGALGSMIILAGWIANLPALESILPGALVVKVNTAIGLFLVSIAAFGLIERGDRARWIVLCCAGGAVIIGGVTLVEYAAGMNAGFDQFLLRELPGAPLTSSPGRMALATALGLTMLGVAELLRDARRLAVVVDLMLLSALMIAVFGVIAAAYGVDTAIGGIVSSRISTPTALMIVALSLAIGCSRPGSGIARIIGSDTPAGQWARVLLPVAFLLPMGVAWLHVWGEQMGLYPKEFGVVLVAFLNSALLVALVLYGAHHQVRAGERLREREHTFTAMLEHSADAVALMDPSGVVRFTTQSSERITGYPPGEFVGRNVLEIVHPDDRSAVVEALARAMRAPANSVSVTLRLQHKNGRWLWIDATGTNLLAAPGVEAMVVNYRDITERRRADEEIRFQAHLLEVVGQAVIATDLDGRILFWNHAAETLYGWSREEALGRSSAEITPTNQSRTDADAFRARLVKGESWEGEFSIRRKDGTRFDAFVHNSAIRGAGGLVVGIVGVSSDITERNAAEAALLHAEEQYREIFENALEGIFQSTPDGRFVSVNDALARIYGASTPAELIERVSDISHQIFVEPEKRAEFRRLVEAQGVVKGFEFETRRFDGSTTWVLENARVVRDATGNVAYYEGVVQDIGPRKNAEAALRKSVSTLESLIATSPVAIFALDANRRISVWNPAAETMYGWSAAELLGKRNPTVPPDKAEESASIYRLSLAGEVIPGIETARLHKSGARIDVLLSSAPLRGDNGEVVGLMAIVQDITARRAAEDHLHRSLAEKEILLKEVHHRVKNNLQVIASMLSLQGAASAAAHEQSVLAESRNRVRAMGLVHELLYRSPDLAHIDFAKYFQSLAETMFTSYVMHPGAVSLRFDLDPTPMDVDTAIPCGLIANELLTNALKYAFPGGRRGVIMAILRNTPDGACTMSIVDDGIGLPAEFDSRNSQTLGMQLITTLCEQLGATLDISSCNGTRVAIGLPTATPSRAAGA